MLRVGWVAGGGAGRRSILPRDFAMLLLSLLAAGVRRSAVADEAVCVCFGG